MRHALLFGGTRGYGSDNFYLRSFGAHKIATHLRKQGWEVEVIDFVQEFSRIQLTQILNDRITDKTEFIGLSSLFDGDPLLNHRFTQIYEIVNGRVPVIAGSQKYASLDAFPADYYFVGFGEEAIDQWLDTGISFIEHDGRRIVDATRLYPSFPRPDSTIDYEERDLIQSYEVLNIEMSRGCKFHCSFCTFTPLGVRGDFTRDADSYVNEMQRNYDKWGVTSYLVSDETINDTSMKMEKFARATERLSFQPTLHGFVRADLIISRPQDWDNMLRCGMIGHAYGVETFHPEAGKAIRKGMDSERVKDGLLEVYDYFTANSHAHFDAHASNIIGLPFESLASVREGIRWYQDNWKGSTLYVPLTLYRDRPNPIDTLSRFDENYDDWGYTWDENGWIHPSGEYTEDDAKKLFCSFGNSRHVWNLPWLNMGYRYKTLIEKYKRSKL